MNFEVHEGGLVSLIGYNGAGMTTTMKATAGTLPLLGGAIEFLGKSIKGCCAWDLIGEGVLIVPEGRGIFTCLTITENLQISLYTRKDKAEIARDIDRVFTTFPRIKKRANQLAGTMDADEQKTFAMARPKVLLDEPWMGLSRSWSIRAAR